MALLMLAMGIVFLTMRKKQAAARRERVDRGELTAEQAKKNDKLFSWSGYGVTACGLFLLAMWLTGN